ncbi:MAG: site-specific DNA-methyltransferase, partial [Armatimonadota bacterium]
QDAQDLEVPIVPVYIQEKIHPQAIVEDIKRNGRQEGTDDQPALFDDFNGIEFEDLIDFYEHEANWSNRMILGDSLQVMTSLAEKEGLKGQVQMIYIDPPYGIKFGSNWQVSTRDRTVRDTTPEHVTRQPEQVKAFRDTWEKGIHSYLTYLRDRLVAARELLTGTGSLLMQIGDENVHLVRSLLDEVFGSENFIAEIAFKKTGGLVASRISTVFDYLIWYAKDSDRFKYRPLYTPKEDLGSVRKQYDWIALSDGTRRRASNLEIASGTSDDGDAEFFKLDNPTSAGNPEYAFEFQGKAFKAGFKTTHEGMQRLTRANRLQSAGEGIYYVRYLADFGVSPLTNLWTDTSASFQRKSYVVQTVTKVVQRCLLMTTDPGDLVLDPTCGSGTTAVVAEEWGRRWITVDTSRVALALARTRLMSSTFPYYILADSPAGSRRRAQMAGRPVSDANGSSTSFDIKQGFVYHRAPHTMLSDIVHNDEIDEIYERWQAKMEPVREQINDLLGESFEEWKLPREPEEDWPEEAAELLETWWEMRLQRQEEIDESIARHSEAEILYDQPYEDNKRVRVAGPFTVESLSPHRVLSTDQELPETERAAQDDAAGPGQFHDMIIDHLRKTPVQNTFKEERLELDRLDPYPGRFIHAEGEYTRKDGEAERVAVTIGPEHGTVGPDLIKDAAKEAVQGIGFDVLLVCGFAFDAHADEESKRYGQLTVLPVRMNPDLSMGDELLKKTGAGNLFMIFGEPDLDIRREDGQMVVEISGLDIYDPTTGEIRNSSTDDIACWFIDTNYNGESFFVRHAYFTGGDEPYDQLARALRADVDEEAWQQLYSTESRPFDPPETGRIAVKIINHYGDEVLKVYEVAE